MKGVRRKNLAAAPFYAVPGFITGLKISVVQIIKVVTFNMNPMFTEITLNSFILVMNIFCTVPTRKFGIIGITTHCYSSFCLLHTQPVSGRKSAVE